MMPIIISRYLWWLQLGSIIWWSNAKLRDNKTLFYKSIGKIPDNSSGL